MQHRFEINEVLLVDLDNMSQSSWCCSSVVCFHQQGYNYVNAIIPDITYVMWLPK